MHCTLLFNIHHVWVDISTSIVGDLSMDASFTITSKSLHVSYLLYMSYVHQCGLWHPQILGAHWQTGLVKNLDFGSILCG